MDENVSIEFPRDHYNHRDLKTEWWYLAGIGELEGIGPANYHLSFFRKFSSHLKREIYFAHFGLNKNGSFEFEEKKSDHASSDNAILHVFIDNWDFHRSQDRYVAVLDKKVSLVHTANKQPAVHGPGYYSVTDLDVRGSIHGDAFKGKGWFDHEFVDLSGIQLVMLKYRWFALQFDKGLEIMLYLMPQTSLGTIVFPNGKVDKIAPGDYCLRDGSNQDWVLEIPPYGISVRLQKKTESEITGHLGPNYTEGTFDVLGKEKIGHGFFEIARGL